MKIWLSRQADGTYLLTRYKPIKKKIKSKTEKGYWLYSLYGEPMDVTLCDLGTSLIFGRHLKPFESVKVNLTLDEITEKR